MLLRNRRKRAEGGLVEIQLEGRCAERETGLVDLSPTPLIAGPQTASS
jgi:hypothetical protein